METSPRARIATDLDAAFDLPERFDANPEMVELYSTVVSNLRSEARGIPMNTVQTLLLERIAFYYVSLKMAERDGELTPTQLKDLTKFWLDMTVEFNKQLAAGHEKLREALLMQISEMVMEKLSFIPDRDTKTQLVLALKEGFAEMGL